MQYKHIRQEIDNRSQSTRIGIVSKKYLVIALAFAFSLLSHGISTIAFAEVDPAKLAEILSQLAGTGVNIPVKADHLEISASPTARLGESIDITVRAVTKSGAIASDYKGTVFINVKEDYKAIVPYVDGYTFTASDKGKKTFSKGLSFSKIGTFQVDVSDVDTPDLIGNASVVVSEKDDTVSPEAVIPSFKILKVETGDGKATFTFQVLNETTDIKKFEFLYADGEGKTDKAITLEKDRIKNANGEYVWYIPNMALTKYTVSIAWVGADGETLSGVISQPFVADLSLLSAGKCIIPNVSGMRVLSKKDTSILYWDSIPEAISYKIYKKNAQGEYIFLEETEKDSYTIYVADGSVKYEEFSVKAVCSDGTESIQFAPSTNVKTGPSELILLGLVSILISFVIMRKRKFFWKV